MTVLHEYALASIPPIYDTVCDVPNGKFIPKDHHYNANNKRKKGKKK